MEDLIKALQILLKYGNPEYPTHCDHDELFICGIDPDKVSTKDKTKLEELGFEIHSNLNQFYSIKYGSV